MIQTFGPLFTEACRYWPHQLSERASTQTWRWRGGSSCRLGELCCHSCAESSSADAVHLERREVRWRLPSWRSLSSRTAMPWWPLRISARVSLSALSVTAGQNKLMDSWSPVVIPPYLSVRCQRQAQSDCNAASTVTLHQLSCSAAESAV